MQFDIVIIGGGPAGAATALSLTDGDDLSVAIFDRKSSFTISAKIGETLQPEVRPLLETLSVWDEFLDANHEQTHSSSSAWGSPELQHQDFLFRTTGGIGWHLDRKQFDQMLLSQAERKGTKVFREYRLVWVKRNKMTDPWLLGFLDARGKEHQITTKMVVDASGRAAVFARKQKAERVSFDRLIGAYAYFDSFNGEGFESGQSTLVEASPDGWLYSASLPNGQLVVARMMDAESAQKAGQKTAEWWLNGVAECSHTRSRIGNAKMMAPPKISSANSQRTYPVVGDFWLAAGDAASSFDPLSSRGIASALAGGVRVATAIRTGKFGHYEQTVVDEFEHYLEVKKRYYRMERRWPDNHFWRSRGEYITVSPLQIVTLSPSPGLRSPYPMYLPRTELEVILQICKKSIPAYRLVERFHSATASAHADRRVIEAIQHLAETGHLTLRGAVES